MLHAFTRMVAGLAKGMWQGRDRQCSEGVEPPGAERGWWCAGVGGVMSARAVRLQLGRTLGLPPRMWGWQGVQSDEATHWRGRTGWGRAPRCRGGSRRL